MTTFTSTSRTILFLILVLLLAACGSDDGDDAGSTEPETSPTTAEEPETRGLVLADRVKAPDFELIDHNGDPFRLSDHEGRAIAVFFGYTHCPDVCPLTLMHMGEAREELGDLADEALFLFITVDPERDTPEQMSKYITRAGEGVIGLTGDQETLEGIWSAYDITVELEPRDDGSYLVAHSAQIWMINPAGEVALILPPSADGDDLAHDLRWLLEQSG
jgi:protein SCO1